MIERQLLVLMQQPPAHFRPDAGYGGGWDDAAARKARRRVAEGIAREHGLQLESAWSMDHLGLDCYLMTAPPGVAVEPLVQKLSADRRIAWAQPVRRYQAQGGGDPLFALQPAATAWHLAGLRHEATGRGVRVAVIDSRVDAAHPDLAGQVERQADFVDGPAVPESHGTAVAGIIAARADDGVGMAGIAPQARLLALRACHERGGATLCSSLGLALALHDAIAHDAQVINLSLSGPPDRLLQRLLDAALDQGCTVVAAADEAAADGGFPASHPGVVAVAMQPVPGRDRALAPGRDVMATLPGGRWQPLSGASYAAAEVSGLFALLRQQGAPAAGRQAGAALARTPTGEIDACASLARAAGRCRCDCPAVHDAAAGGTALR
jgi:subtilisin family serine protease